MKLEASFIFLTKLFILRFYSIEGGGCYIAVVENSADAWDKTKATAQFRQSMNESL